MFALAVAEVEPGPVTTYPAQFELTSADAERCAPPGEATARIARMEPAAATAATRRLRLQVGIGSTPSDATVALGPGRR